MACSRLLLQVTYFGSIIDYSTEAANEAYDTPGRGYIRELHLSALDIIDRVQVNPGGLNDRRTVVEEKTPPRGCNSRRYIPRVQSCHQSASCRKDLVFFKHHDPGMDSPMRPSAGMLHPRITFKSLALE